MLPDVKLAFEIVDGYFASDEPSAITDAWEILKSAVLAQQTGNTQITPCPECSVPQRIESMRRWSWKYCPDCGRKIPVTA